MIDLIRINVMIGIPGSGKSTWVKNNHKGCEVYSTDNRHIRDGVYKYDPEMASIYHGHTLLNYVYGLTVKRFGVIVDNTNTTLAEIAPYIALGLAHGRSHYVEPVLVKCDPAIAWARNVHDVPAEVVYAKHANLEKLLAEWPSYWPAITVVNAESNE
jgi:predicted kinase